MRNDLLNTARRGRIEKRKGYKAAQKTPKGTQKLRPLSEVVLSAAVGVVFEISQPRRAKQADYTKRS
jgi:hypothetical protein